MKFYYIIKFKYIRLLKIKYFKYNVILFNLINLNNPNPKYLIPISPI